MNSLTRERLGRALYRILNRDTFAVAWDDLPDNRRERYRIAAELLAQSDEMDAYLTELRAQNAA